MICCYELFLLAFFSDKFRMINLAVSFGELDISPVTIAILVGISIFIFLAVGLSSVQLVQSLLKGND